MGKYDDLRQGDTEATFNMLGGLEGARHFRAGRTVLVERLWRDNMLAVERKLGGEAGVKRFLDGELAIAEAQSLLEPVGTVPMAGVSRFVAADHFRVDIAPEAAVKIAYLGDNFQAVFLGQVEENVERATLRIHRLAQDTLDAPILVALGTKAATSLTQIWELLTRQPSGESGSLLTNGFANIFYVRNAAGVLWAVGAGWGGGGWGVDARSVGGPRRWGAGGQVFSC